MKLTAVWAMAVLAGTNLSAKDAKAFAHTVQICADRTIEFGTLVHARAIAAQMFAGIGIKIEWVDSARCPGGAILLGFSVATPATERPGSLAYALPYEGSHVVIYYDRIVPTVEARDVPAVLAHVMAHEVTHILQGVSRHSPDGVMKALWNRDDYTQMAWEPLPFAQEDVDLIYRGLEKREEIASRQSGGGVRDSSRFPR